jgi:2-succinyl-6-hydroxy-2,4-cyclohexadiene-1-carboxylate synthase
MTPAVLLLHGFTHTGASWEAVIAALGERYRATAPDIRGHGGSSDSTPVTLEAVLSDLDALAPTPLTLAGYSMGGRISLHAALALRDRVQRLVLSGASPGIAAPGERDARRRADDQLAAELEQSSIEAFAPRWARTPVLAGLPPDVLARVHADRLRSTPLGLARALRGLGTGALPSLWGRLEELTIPVALVVGERDEKFQEIAERMAELIADVAIVVVPGAGHAVHLEAPERVAAIIAGDDEPSGWTAPRTSGRIGACADPRRPDGRSPER